MSSKFKKQQNHKKWSEDKTRLPHEFRLEVSAMGNSTSTSSCLRKISSLMLEFIDLQSSYAELECMKRLAPQVASLPLDVEEGVASKDKDKEFETAVGWLLDIVFCENSQPLHRQIFSVFKNVSDRGRAILENCMDNRIRAAALQHHKMVSLQSKLDKVVIGEGRTGAPVASNNQASITRQLCPDIINFMNRKCAVATLLGLLSELQPTVHGSSQHCHIAPMVMDDVTNAMSSLYLIITKHGASIAEGAGGPEAVEVMESLSLLLIDVLKGTAFVRDAMRATAVALWSIVSLSCHTSAYLSAIISSGLFFNSEAHIPFHTYSEARPEGVVESALRKSRRGSFVDEMRRFSHIGHVCAVRGAIAMLPTEVLCAPLQAKCKLESAEIGLPWVMLVDGALKHLTASVSTACDAHQKFHILSSLSHVLDRIKHDLHIKMPSMHHDNGISGALASHGINKLEKTVEKPFAAVSMEQANAVFQVLSSCWEEPLSQSVKKVHEAFENLLDVQMAQAAIYRSQNNEAASMFESFAMNCAIELLKLGSHKKGKYTPLAAIVEHAGALPLLKLDKQLLLNVVSAMKESTVCTAAVSLLGAILMDLSQRNIGDNSDTVLKAWQDSILDALLSGLLQDNDLWRNNLCTYALPVLFKIQPSACGRLLEQASSLDVPDGEKVAAIIAILKAGRSLNLIKELDQITWTGQGDHVTLIPLDMLYMAMSHGNDSVRLTCMELACTHPRKSSLPGLVELALVKHGLVFSMRCTSSATRNKITALLSKLLHRIRNGSMGIYAKKLNKDKIHRGQKSSSHLSDCNYKSVADSCNQTPETEDEVLARAQIFIQWLTNFSLGCLYPGAPFERKYMAMDILLAVVDTCNMPLESQGISNQCNDSQDGLNPYYRSIFLPSTTQLLLGACVDSWDRMRDGAMDALVKLPSPLPGLEHSRDVKHVLKWSCKLLESPRSVCHKFMHDLSITFINHYVYKVLCYTELYHQPS